MKNPYSSDLPHVQALVTQLNDYHQMSEQLGHVQKRCTELLEENRKFKRKCELLKQPRICDRCKAPVFMTCTKCGETYKTTPEATMEERLREAYAALSVERNKLKDRLRTTAQILVDAVGADGPMDAGEAAAKCVRELRLTQKESNDAHKLITEKNRHLRKLQHESEARLELVAAACDLVEDELSGDKEATSHRMAQLISAVRLYRKSLDNGTGVGAAVYETQDHKPLFCTGKLYPGNLDLFAGTPTPEPNSLRQASRRLYQLAMQQGPDMSDAWWMEYCSALCGLGAALSNAVDDPDPPCDKVNGTWFMPDGEACPIRSGAATDPPKSNTCCTCGGSGEVGGLCGSRMESCPDCGPSSTEPKENS